VKAAIALVLMLSVVPAHGQLLKCVGKDGKVEYAAQCPPGSKELQTGIKSTPGGPKPSASPQQKSLAEREADFRKRQLEGTEARQKEEAKAAEKAAQREDCERARTYVKSLQEGQRIAQVDPKTGERVFLDDANRPAEIARAQKIADSNCK
jgi:hypothetical protein